MILQSPTEELLKYAIRLSFSVSNIEAKYEVVLVGLDFALTLVATKLEICSDSQLIVGQIQREYEAKNELVTHYLTMVEDHLKRLDRWTVRWVPVQRI